MTPLEKRTAEAADQQYGFHIHSPLAPLDEDDNLIGWVCQRCGELFTVTGQLSDPETTLHQRRAKAAIEDMQTKGFHDGHEAHVSEG